LVEKGIITEEEYEKRIKQRVKVKQAKMIMPVNLKSVIS
jgi:hypothetical protein